MGTWPPGAVIDAFRAIRVGGKSRIEPTPGIGGGVASRVESRACLKAAGGATLGAAASFAAASASDAADARGV